MKDLFIIIGFIILVIYFIIHLLSHPDLTLGRFGAKRFGYKNWLFILFIIWFTLELILLFIYLDVTN